MWKRLQVKNWYLLRIAHWENGFSKVSYIEIYYIYNPDKNKFQSSTFFIY